MRWYDLGRVSEKRIIIQLLATPVGIIILYSATTVRPLRILAGAYLTVFIRLKSSEP